MNNIDVFLKTILHEVKISVEKIEFTHCQSNWRGDNYTPYFSSLGFILDGEGWIKVNDLDLYPTKGQMYLLPAGSLQSFSNISDNTYKKYYCHFCAKVGSLSIFDILQIPLCINIIDRHTTENIVKQLQEAFSGNDVVSLIKTKVIILQLIINYIENCSQEGIQILNKNINMNIIKAVNFIEDNLREELNVKKIAEVSNYHPCYFTKLFKDTFNSSPIQYITIRRVDKSKLFLTSTNLTISQIAEEVGFNSQFYFSNIFKIHTGLTPTEFRNAYHANVPNQP